MAPSPAADASVDIAVPVKESQALAAAERIAEAQEFAEAQELAEARELAEAQEIAEKLTREGYDIDALHGDLTQHLPAVGDDLRRVSGAPRRHLDLEIDAGGALDGIDHFEHRETVTVAAIERE